MNLQESIRRILREETEPGIFVELMESILQHLKEEDCICDIKVSFDVEENYYDVYLVFGQEELNNKFSGIIGIRNYIAEMMNDVKNEIEAFLPIKNIFIGYYSKQNCGWSPLNESEDDKEKNLNVLTELISMFDYSEVCDMWLEYDPEDGYYAIRSKMNTKNHNTKALEKEFEFLEKSIKSLGLKAYVSHPYWVEECEDKNELNESEDKNQSLLSLIEEHGLYEFMKMTGLSMGQIILKYDNLPREVFERYIKDFINEEGYHQTDGSVQLVYVVKIQTHVYIDHFYMEGDKVTLEIKRFDNRGHQSEGYIESLSNLTDEEIFTIVDDMTSLYNQNNL